MKVLQVDSGLFLGQSVSRQLTTQITARLQSQNDNAEVIHRDLITEPVAHLDGEILMAGGIAEGEQSDRQRIENALTEALLEELFAADVVVIGAPMYNFSVPSQLKAWIDRIAKAGRTFRYTEQGPEGLLTGKKAIIASARGGIYSEGAAAAMEHQESYLKSVLAFIGITDVTIIRAEGVNLGEEAKSAAVDGATQQINALSAA